MDEKSLWNELKKGDKSALEKIYRTFFKELFNYGKRFSSDTSLVEDSIQDLFIDIWNKKENLADLTQIKPYLFVSLRRKIISEVKKKRVDTGIELEDNHFEASLSFEDILISKEGSTQQKKELEIAFQKLTNRQKEILYLKFYNQFDYTVISEIMDMNYQSARNLVSRALAKLSQYLALWWLILFNLIKSM